MEAAFVAGGSQQDAEPETGGSEPREEVYEVPRGFDELVEFIFDEEPLQGRLCDVARRKGLGGAPWELPFEAQRAVVAAMIEEAGEAAHAVQPERRTRRSWRRMLRDWSFMLFPEVPQPVLIPIEAAAE